MNTDQLVETKYLSRPGGRISYTVHGTGPLIVAVPGMGDLRSSYRELVGAAYYCGTLNKGTKPAGLDRHVAEIRANLATPGRLRALRTLALALDHTVVQRRITEIRSPRLAFIGSLDSDFADPEAGAGWLARTGVFAELVDEAGHYPHTQRPDVIVPATLQFLARLPRDGAERWADQSAAQDGSQDA